MPGAKVAIFGSRATGRARPHCDPDLLFLEPLRLTWRQRADLSDAFEASELPCSVGVVEVQGLAEGKAQRGRGEARRLN